MTYKSEIYKIKIKINTKNRTYHSFNDIINNGGFNPCLLNIGKKPYKNIDIYYIGYMTIKNIRDCEIIITVKSLYFFVGRVNRHIEEIWK